METRRTKRNTWKWSSRALSGRTSSLLVSGGNGMLLHQAAGLSSSATTWITRSEHLMMLEHSMGWAFRTLDGAGTFHGMGIQNTGWCWNIPWDGHYPGTKHRREVTATLETVSCTMGKVFIRYFDASVVDLSLAYEAVLQNFTAEDKSKILRLHSLGGILALVQAGLGWCRACATGYILVRVLSFPTHDRYGPNQHELHISTLISGTTLWSHTSSHLWPALWWKATEVVDDEPPDCVPWSIVLRVGGFHTEMSCLVCTGRLTAGSGLQQLLEVLFAQNSVTHMLTARPSPEQFEEIFLQMLSVMLNAIERE